MLDHQHGAVLGDAADQRGDALDILLPEPRHRLVEQHHLGFQREGRGDLQGALAAIGQVDRLLLGERRQPDRLDQLQRALVQLVEHALGAPEEEGIAQLALKRDAHVLTHRQVREHRRDLERPHQAHASDCRRGGTGDVLAVELDAARGGRQKLGEQVETGRLARAVGPDQRMDSMAPDLQVDVLDGDEALEFLGQPLGFQNCLLFRHFLPTRCRD